MVPAYFDSDVFLSIFSGSPQAASIRALLRELKHDKTRVYTSIITVQETSVSTFLHGGTADTHVRVAKLARIAGVTKNVALLAAKFEAEIMRRADKTATPEDQKAENRRRKWDCFHLATAVDLACRTFYTFDAKYESRVKLLGLSLDVRTPDPRTPLLIDIT